MQKYNRDKFIFVFIVTTLLLLAPIDKYLNRNSFRFWPYYHWEIGFGEIPFTIIRPIIHIHEVDGIALAEPVRLVDFFIKNELTWIPTKDYLIQRELLHSFKSSTPEKIQAILIEKYFKQFAKKSVAYTLSEITLDPVAYLKNKSIFKQRVLLKVESAW